MLQLRRFVSLDTSTRAVGFASWDSGHLVDYGVVKFKKNTTYRRLIVIAEEMEELFNLLDVDSLVIETAYFGMNPSTTTSLALVQGVVIGAGALNGIEEGFGIPPRVWQSGIGNDPLTLEEKIEIQEANPERTPSWYAQYYRKFRKQRTIDIINKEYELEITNDDIADAIGIGMHIIKSQEKAESQ